MNKKSLEIAISVGSVILFIILIATSKLILGTSAGFGFAASLLIFIVIMGLAGLKLAEVPEK
jgi:ABC-type methionine transport system permease subunit